MKDVMGEVTKAPPLYEEVKGWVDSLVANASGVLRLTSDQVSPDASLIVQAALVSGLVCGRWLPPCRASTIRTLVHPEMVSGARVW